MCNLYSLTKGQTAIRDWFRVRHDRTGNLPLFPGVFPDQMAPIVRTGGDGERELVMARWGMPGPPQYGGAPVTNIRNVTSPHWRGWLGRRNRCLVPATSFCEYADTKPRKTPIWFALSEERPLLAFAGLWASWHGVSGPKSARRPSAAVTAVRSIVNRRVILAGHSYGGRQASMLAADEPDLVPSILPVSRRGCVPHIFLNYAPEQCLFTVHATRSARSRRYKQH